MTTPVPTMRPDELDEPWSDTPSELRTEEGALPLVALDVDGHIAGLVARVRVRQTFENRLDRAIEATYLHPLPDRAAVTRFRMTVADRVVDGTLMERAAARAGYDEAIEQGRRAAIAEENRPDTFSMRVGNIGPGETAVVELDLEWRLPVDGAEATFRFPLVTAPRYVPGSPLDGPNVAGGTTDDTDAVPDASTISPPVLLPGSPNPVRLSVGVTIDADDLGLRGLRSALHDVVMTDGAGTGPMRVELRPGERVDRDFVLRFGIGGDTITTGVTCTPDTATPTTAADHVNEPGAGDAGDRGTGTWYATVVPPAATGSGPRDVVLVLDRSGSMQGWKMVAARRAAARIVDSLRSTDRFAVVAFDHVCETPPDQDGLVAATDRNRYAAVEFLSRLDARGGTQMLPALTQAVAPLEESGDRDAVVVVVTDGQVGNEDQILAGLDPKLGSARLFTVGIDRAVNAGFLRRLAAAGAGRCELVESEDRLDEVMTALHRRIARPVLRDLTIHAGDHDAGEPGSGGFDVVADDTTPGRADCFEGVPLVVAGRYRGRPPATVTLAATDELGDPWTAEVACRVDDRAGHAMWARARVRDLEDAHAVRPDAGLADRIIATSLQFGVLSRFTAYLAVDTTERTSSTDPARIVQPVELPSGWEQASAAPPSPPMRAFVASAPAAASPAAGDGFVAFASPQPPPAAQTSLHLEATGGRLGRALRRRPAREAAGDRGSDGARREEPANPPEARYRDRIDDELAALRSAITGGDRDEARRAIGRLRLLVDDLTSVGATAGLVDRLRAIVDAATAWTTGTAGDDRATLAAIDAFADDAGDTNGTGDGGPSDTGTRRRTFWR
ncbi:MAG: VIT domain-containing protein [Actinomycetota bacterium]|nr:VIT domain-containing protein [Actinomycetota bacterium]